MISRGRLPRLFSFSAQALGIRHPALIDARGKPST